MTWREEAAIPRKVLNLYMGREKDRSLGPRWRIPPEDWAEGCPGGWILSPFVISLMPYYRRQTQSGNRVANRLYDTTDDMLILQAIHYLENEEAHARAHQIEREAAHWESKKG